MKFCSELAEKDEGAKTDKANTEEFRKSQGFAKKKITAEKYRDKNQADCRINNAQFSFRKQHKPN